VAEIFMNEFKADRSGNEIVEAAMKKAEAEGLRPLIYAHPVGVHGHGAGPPMDARSPETLPEGNSIRGAYPLYPDTVYAIEFSSTTSVPDWDKEDVRIGYEENAAFTVEGCRFIDGHQVKFYLIK
jgi:hypothetical protein